MVKKYIITYKSSWLRSGIKLCRKEFWKFVECILYAGYSIPVPQVDYSKIDLSTATVLNKHTNKQEEASDALHLDTTELTNNNNNKKKKAKKQVMSLHEFHVKALGTEVIIHFNIEFFLLLII